MHLQSPVARLSKEVQQRIVERGEPLAHVEEEVIDAAIGLTADQRAGLWLYAWSLQSAAHQRYQALGYLAHLEAAEQSN
jgi:hypothetical protein